MFESSGAAVFRGFESIPLSGIVPFKFPKAWPRPVQIRGILEITLQPVKDAEASASKTNHPSMAQHGKVWGQLGTKIIRFSACWFA